MVNAESHASSLLLPQAFIRTAKRTLFDWKVNDSTGVRLTGGKLLAGTLALRQALSRHVLASDDRFVGILIPPSVGGVLANTALTLDRRIPVNLNYTCNSAVINSCIRQAGIKKVLTSKKVIQKLKLELDAEIVYLEDVRKFINGWTKFQAAALAYACPAFLLERMLGLNRLRPDDLMTLIFTSGSTGEPKGVMLSFHNVGSNVEALVKAFHLRRDDVALGILPFFHSFGFTATLWAILTANPKGVYHINPLEAREIGKLCRENKVTICMATPTFLRNYLRRCEPEDFAALEVVVAGAEKLPSDLSDAFEKRFHVRPVEGYGTTELSPLVSVNIPPRRTVGGGTDWVKEGSVGRPLPGIRAKIVDPDTEQELGLNEPGMLLITGPNVMQGYYNKPELTKKDMRDGWYVTGDIASLDEKGFITISGRLSRFSKIGGEMVPHIRIEEELNKILGADDELKAAVTAVPDSRKGERLIVLHLALDKTPEAMCKALSEAGLPNLWIPSVDSFRQVESIPVLGTGKLDLQKLKKTAQELFPPT